MFNKIGGTDITPFFFIAIAVFAIVLFVMKCGKLGYEINAIGKNLEFAEAAGMKVRTKIIVIMLISGALSGLAQAAVQASPASRSSAATSRAAAASESVKFAVGNCVRIWTRWPCPVMSLSWRAIQ